MLSGHSRWVVPFVIAGALGFAAEPQEALRAGAAIRAGYVPRPTENLAPGSFGFGLNATYRLNSGWALSGELNYSANIGKGFMAPILPSAVGAPPASSSLSADSRKNSLSTLGLRALCRFAWTPNVELLGGLQVGKSRFRHEYIAQYVDEKKTYLETCNGTPTESKLTVSPMLGVSYSFDKDGAVEFNLVGVSYSSIAFRHVPGSPLTSGDPSKPGSHLVYAGDGLVNNHRMMLTAELGYIFRF